jgi:hypothetical protein
METDSLRRAQYTRQQIQDVSECANLIAEILLTSLCLGEETFDISVEAALWLMISIRDRSLVGKHDIVARAYICLDPRRYGDFLAHDLWLDLDPHGRVLMRVSMEGEKDDILFFFGRAFRSLKRTEGDMIRIFIDKVGYF